MKMREKIVVVADTYCQAVGRSRARLSTILFNAGARLDAIADGRDLNTGTYEAAMAWLSQNWPEGAQWPDGIERPDVEAAPEDGGASALTTG